MSCSMLLRRSHRKQRKQDEAQASLALAGQHAEAGRRAQATMPPPAWAPPQAWSQPPPAPNYATPNFAAPNYATTPPPPPPPPPAAPAVEAAPVGEVPAQLLRVLEVVTTMCDHVIEYIEADRAER